jgi:hypothetical protein
MTSQDGSTAALATEPNSVEIPSSQPRDSKASAKAKGKPQAKAKGKASVAVDGKAKAKAKGKAKSKAKAKVKLEESPVEEKSESEADVQKKPASKASRGSEAVAKAKAKAEAGAKPKAKPKAKGAAVKGLKKRVLDGISDAFEDPKQDAGDEGDDGVRDRSKTHKFMQMMSDGMIPPHIVQMFQEAKKGDNPRKDQTSIINSLFSRSEEGRLVIQSHAPMFQAYKDSIERQSFNNKHTGVPKGIFCGQYFGNNEEAMLASFRAGEIKMFKKDGLTFCAFNTMELEDKQEKTSTQHLLQADKKVNKDCANEMLKAWEGISWDFKSIGCVEEGTSSGSGRPLALTDAPAGAIVLFNFLFQSSAHIF